jgi:hypothetical protein
MVTTDRLTSNPTYDLAPPPALRVTIEILSWRGFFRELDRYLTAGTVAYALVGGAWDWWRDRR